MIDHHHCIEGNLSAAVLALGRLCELGWQCSGLESNGGHLHKVFLKTMVWNIVEVVSFDFLFLSENPSL